MTEEASSITETQAQPGSDKTRQSNPGISVIVCTRNRAASLDRTLFAMAKLCMTGVPTTEYLIVDNGSTDGTWEVVERHIKERRIPIRLIGEQRPGLSRARNTGIEAAAGSVIAFTDDDCLPHENWLQIVWDALGTDGRRLVAGRVDLHDSRHLQMSIRLGDEPEIMTQDRLFGGFLLGANMAFGRQVANEVGRFDEMLGAGTALGAAEDTDFAHRALIQGIPVTYEPRSRVSHDHGRQGTAMQQRMIYSHALGGGGMVAKNIMVGNNELVKLLYWEIRSAVRNTWKQPGTWRELYGRRGFVVGAAKYYMARKFGIRVAR